MEACRQIAAKCHFRGYPHVPERRPRLNNGEGDLGSLEVGRQATKLVRDVDGLKRRSEVPEIAKRGVDEPLREGENLGRADQLITAHKLNVGLIGNPHASLKVPVGVLTEAVNLVGSLSSVSASPLAGTAGATRGKVDATRRELELGLACLVRSCCNLARVSFEKTDLWPLSCWRISLLPGAKAFRWKFSIARSR